jgi:hypothetical protein
MLGRPPTWEMGSLFEPLPVSRARRFVDVPEIRFTARGRLPPLTEYRILGPMWHHASWTRTGRRFLDDEVRNADPAYPPGERLEFGDGKRALDYLDYGWRVPVKGADHLWTDGHVAALTVPMKNVIAGPAMLEMELGPYGSRYKTVTRHATVSVNGVAIGPIEVSARDVYRMPIPPGVAGARIAVRLDLPDAISPYGAYGHPDDGLLSLQVFGMRISETAAQ